MKVCQSNIISNTIFSLGFLCILLFAIKSFTENKADVDLWGNLYFCRSFPFSKEFYMTNTFSFTEPDHKWINHEWLSQYIFYRVYNNTGAAGLIILKLTISVVILAFIFIANRFYKHTSYHILFFFFILIISIIAYGINFRPHLFTYLFVSLYIFFLLSPRAWLLFLVFSAPTAILWANLHGAFFLGIVIMLLRTIKALFIVIKRRSIKSIEYFVISSIPPVIFFICSSYVTPYKTALWKFIWNSAKFFRPFLDEWAPVSSLSDILKFPDYTVILICAIMCLILRFNKMKLTTILIIVISIISSLILKRNIPLSTIAIAFVLPIHLESLIGKQLQKTINSMHSLFKITIPALLCLLSIAYTINRKYPLKIEVKKDEYPFGAIYFLARYNITGNCLVFSDWGEYIIYNFFPKIKVFIDGRFDSAYSFKIITDYLNFIYGTHLWKNVIDKYNIDIVLIHPLNPVYKNISKYTDYQLVYQDNQSALFIKNEIAKNMKLPDKVLSYEIKSQVIIFPASPLEISKEIYGNK